MKFGFSDLPTAMCYRLKLAACSTPVRWEIWESTDEVKIQTVPGPEHSIECGGLQVYVLAVQQSLALLSILPVPSVRSTDRTEFLNRTNCAAAATPTARYGARRAAATGRSWSAMAQWSWAVVQREKKYMAYDLHPVLIPYLVSQNSSKLKYFNEGFLSNCDFRVFPLYAHSRFQGFNL